MDSKEQIKAGIESAEDFDALEAMYEIAIGEKNADLCVLKEAIPENFGVLLIVKRIAMETGLGFTDCQRAMWQNYFFRCCISEKCNAMFEELGITKTDRINFLDIVCNKNSILFAQISEEARASYVSLQKKYAEK